MLLVVSITEATDRCEPADLSQECIGTRQKHSSGPK